MSKENEKDQSVPKSVPKIFIIKPPMAVNYSQPKLYIPKKNGKPCLDRRWYVYFYFKDAAGKSIKISKTHKINRIYKTISQRKEFGNNLVHTYTEMLAEGYNPLTNQIPRNLNLPKQEMTCREALNLAFEQKKNNLAAKTIGDWKSRLNTFLKYADAAGFAEYNINEITSFHIASFLNFIADGGQGPKSINNFRGCLSALFGKLANDMIVQANPVSVLKKRKENPKKNKPFTPEEIKEIKKYLLLHDPGLLTYVRFVAFAFLRPVEVVRLTVGDVDLKNFRLSVKTKTETRATVRIVPQLVEELQAMQLHTFAKTDFLLTPEGTPGNWANQRTGEPTAENTRTKEFSDRFTNVKDHFNFGPEYGIYSVRHSFAVDLYNSFINAGATTIEAEMKMLPITRHKSLSGLRNYLRDVGALMPKDYGKDFTLDF